MTNFQNSGIDLELTEYAEAYYNESGMFGGSVMSPTISTPDLDGTYKKNNNAHLRRYNTKRGSGAPSIRIKGDYSDAPYKVIEHGAAMEITKRDKIKSEKATIDWRSDMTRSVVDALKIDREAEVVEIATDVAEHTTVGHHKALTGGERFNKSTSEPFKVAREMRREVYDDTGVLPDVLGIGIDVWLEWSEHDEFLARMEAMGIEDPTVDALVRMLGSTKMMGKAAMPNMRIALFQAVKNTALEKPSETSDDNSLEAILNKSIIMAKVEPQMNIMSREAFSAYGTFELENFSGFEIVEREDEDKDLTIIEGKWWYNPSGLNYKLSSLRTTVID